MTMLTTKEDIKSWLKKYEIDNYTINSDLSVDVQGDVYIDAQKLTSIPVQFNRVSGSFNCARNQLTSLHGSPQSVGGSFDCSYNQLKLSVYSFIVNTTNSHR